MAQNQGWVKVLRPWLEAKRDQTFPDPQSFTEEAAFTYAAKVTSIYKKIVQEILSEIEKRIELAKYLQKKARGEVEEPFAIGSLEGGEKTWE